MFVGDCKDVLFFDVILLIFGIEIEGGIMILFVEWNMMILVEKKNIFSMVVDN